MPTCGVTDEPSCSNLNGARGQWSNVVDFDQPDVEHIECLVANKGGRVKLPLLTIGKEMLPPAHVETRDECGDWLSLEESTVGRWLAFRMLLAAAHDAALCSACAPLILWQLTSSDTVDAYKAWCKLGELFHDTQHARDAAWVPNDRVPRFINLARLFYRSMLLVGLA